MYMEDLDLCWRLRRGGWDVVYEPARDGAARAGREHRRATRTGCSLEHHRSAWRFAQRRFTGWRPVLLPFTAVYLALRAVLAALAHHAARPRAGARPAEQPRSRLGPVGKASRNRRRAAAVKARRTRSGSPFWYAATGVIIIVGVVAIALSRGSNADDRAVREHRPLARRARRQRLRHLARRTRPAFEDRAGARAVACAPACTPTATASSTSTRSRPTRTGKNATVGRFLKYGGWKRQLRRA